MFQRADGSITLGIAQIVLSALLDLTLTPLVAEARTFSNGLFENSFGVPGQDATYDYVVVGGGTAGNTIAARLAEDPSVSIAIVEAGSFYEVENGNGSVIPYLAPFQGVGTEPNDTQPLIDWGFVTVPQPGMANRRIHYARGKCLGGSSARNYMAYHRPTVGSFQKWADEVGDTSYTWDNVLPFFKKSPHLTPPNKKTRAKNGTVQYDPKAFSPKGAPLQVSWPNFVQPFLTWGPVALKAVGIPISKIGFNSGVLNGGAFSTASIDPAKEERSSSEASFLQYAIQNTSLKIYVQALVKRILFSEQNTATGVLVQTGSKTFTIRAKKEVIVSAGSIQSPQLLMVSGIGPKETLTKFGISVRKNLPGVGQNLWDQPLFAVAYRVNVVTGSKLLYDPEYALEKAKEYIENQDGPLTASPGYLAWERLPKSVRQQLTKSTQAELAKFPRDWPEVEYLWGDLLGGDPANGNNYAAIAAGLMAPSSRGNVTISSADMSDPPVINVGLLSTASDSEVAVAAFKRVREMWKSLPITIGDEYFPGKDVKSDAQILAFLREQLALLYHASATCKMGKASDSMAVVDPQARVYGTNSLRVVDASAFPFLTPGHPQSVVYMLAEKIACDIKGNC